MLNAGRRWVKVFGPRTRSAWIRDAPLEHLIAFTTPGKEGTYVAEELVLLAQGDNVEQIAGLQSLLMETLQVQASVGMDVSGYVLVSVRPVEDTLRARVKLVVDAYGRGWDDGRAAKGGSR